MTETARCPLCGPVEARVVAVDIARPDGTMANEYRCTRRGHLFLADQDSPPAHTGGK